MAVLVAELILLLLGLSVAAFFVPRSLGDLRGMKNAEASRRWKSAPPETTTAIRAAWRRGSAVAESEDAGLAVAMSEHVDRVLAATRRVSFWVCAPLAPGVLLTLGGLPRVLWLVAGVPLVLSFTFSPVAARSRKRRHRSIDLTKEQYSV